MARTKMRAAGPLIESVAFDELSSVADGYGNMQQTFVEQVKTRASVTWLRGSEGIDAARLEGQQPAIVRIRVSEATLAIKPDWRMRDLRTGTIYAIRGITRSTDRGWLDVLVQSGRAP